MRFFWGPVYAAEDGSAAGGGDTVEPAVPEAPEPETTAEATAAESNDETRASPPAIAPAVAAPQAQDWRDRRIAQLTARLREAEAKAKEQGAPPAAPSVDVESLANARANEIAAAQRFNDQCNEVAKQGKQSYNDFDSRVGALTQLVDRNDPASIGAYNQFLSAAIETGEAARLIYELGGDLNEASRIMSLSPTKMGVELGRKAASAEAQISKTPRPITPVGGRGPAHEAIDPTDSERADRLSTRAWMERREAQLRARSH